MRGVLEGLRNWNWYEMSEVEILWEDEKGWKEEMWFERKEMKWNLV